MGLIRGDFGPFSLETSGDGVTIHASYGWRDARCKRSQLLPGSYFRYPDSDEVRYVESMNTAVIHMQDGGDALRDETEVIPCHPDGSAHDEEVDEAGGRHGKHWREEPHPVILRQDLGDLIAALTDLRDNP
jgi:hypothetical protein